MLKAMSRVGAIVKIAIAVLVLLLAFLTIALVRKPGPQEVSPEIISLDRQKEIKDKFAQLYDEDPEFKRCVDSIREMILNPEVPYDSSKAKDCYNTILTKLGFEPVEKFTKGPGTIISFTGKAETVRCASLNEVKDFILKIAMPESDVEKGNGLVVVYACGYEVEGKLVVELTLVWGDEDDPQEDERYDVWRLVAWGRLEDIETLFIVAGKAPSPTYVVSTPLYLQTEYNSLRRIGAIGSGGAFWVEGAHRELRARLEEGILYVNTWNHALGVRDNNPHLKKKVYVPGVDVPLKIGRRLDAEKDYSSIEYLGELVPELRTALRLLGAAPP